MDLLQDMMEIYKILDPEQKLLEVYNATVTVEALDNILAKIGCHIPANEMMTITRKPWKDGAVLYIGLDYALGLLIQIRQMKVHESYIRMLPGGDDTYFDYYPGDMFYMTAVMDWFLNDGPRMA